MSVFRYALKDIRNHKFMIVLFLVLTIIMFFMFGLLLDHVVDSCSLIRGLKELRKNTDEAYVLVDTTSEEKFSELWRDEQGTVKKYKEFFNTLDESGLTYYTAYSYVVDTTDEGDMIREQIITEKFMDIFNLSTASGRLFDNDDFSTITDPVPILVGYELQDDYQLGKTYELLNGGTGESFKGIVVGILSKDSAYYELNSIDISIPLDYSYIVPQSMKDVSNMEFSDLDMAETRMIVFGSKDEIQRIVSTQSPIDITLIGATDKIDDILNTHRDEIKLLSMILSVIVLIFAGIMWGFYLHLCNYRS